MTDAETLRAAIQASGLSARAFAKRVVITGVNERTVRRWLAGEWPVPPDVLKQAKRLARLEPQRQRLQMSRGALADTLIGFDKAKKSRS